MVVLAIGLQLAPPSVEDSQPDTLVNVPPSNNVPLFVPEQTEALELTVPEEGASTVIMAGVEFVIAQLPLCTTALYCIV